LFYLHGTEKAKFIYEQIINPDWFDPSATAFGMLLGLLILSAKPGGNIAGMIFSKLGTEFMNKFFGACGLMAGWALSVSVSYAWTNGYKVFPQSIVLGGYALVLTLSFLWAYENMLPIAQEYSQFRIRERRGQTYMQCMGSIIFIYSFWSAMNWTSGKLI
jgi:hypothetical protein